ncbi:MAG: bifunctional nuclease family protein [Spirochaetaceae bacterium]|nr:MAG: bifunctional nuclease family protein [Spirochaetaceae bacterium]
MAGNWQEYAVLGVTLHGRQDDPSLLLQHTSSDSVVALTVGASEAAAVVLEIEGVVSSTPLTHHLLPALFVRHGFEALRLELQLDSESQPVATLYYRALGEDHRLLLRPSDGVSIALRFGLPIYVDSEILPGRMLDFETVTRISNELLLVDRRASSSSPRIRN